MDEEKRHILYVNGEDLIKCLMERKDWIYQELFKERILKEEKGRVLAELVDDPKVRNTIYMQELSKRNKE